MFNTLSISTINRRRKRTAKFFLGTAVFYLLSVAAAFALSIVIANPQLADTSAHSALMIVPMMPEASQPSTPAAPRSSSQQAATRNDPTHVRDLADIRAANTPAPKSSAVYNGPPMPGRVGSETGFGGGEYIPGAIGSGIPDGREHGEVTKPPQPPDPPKQVAQIEPKVNRLVKLPSSVLQGKAIVRHTPDYPALAKQSRLEGSVSVEVIISPDGRVESARAVSGHAIFRVAAESAAKGWRFGPTLLNGMAVQVTGVIVFNFRLNQ
jgi:protein TonB